MTKGLWPWQPAPEAKTTGSAADCPEHSGLGQQLPLPKCSPLLPIRDNQRKLNVIPKTITQDAHLQLSLPTTCNPGTPEAPLPHFFFFFFTIKLPHSSACLEDQPNVSSSGWLPGQASSEQMISLASIGGSHLDVHTMKEQDWQARYILLIYKNKYITNKI